MTLSSLIYILACGVVGAVLLLLALVWVRSGFTHWLLLVVGVLLSAWFVYVVGVVMRALNSDV